MASGHLGSTSAQQREEPQSRQESRIGGSIDGPHVLSWCLLEVRPWLKEIGHSQQRGLSQALQGVKVQTEPTAIVPAQMDPTEFDCPLVQPSPPTSTEGPRAVPQSTQEVPPPSLLQGLQEPGGEGPSLRTVSSGHRAEEAQAVPGVKGRLAGDRPPRRSAPVRPEGTPEDETCPWSLPVTPAHTPVGGPTPVIMPLVEISELRQPEADLQAPVKAQLVGAEGEKATSSSSSTSSGDAYVELLPQEALRVLIVDLVAFLLFKCRTQELTSKAEILNVVLRDHQDHFTIVFGKACECVQLVFGVAVKEVVHLHERTYVLVPILGLTSDAMLSDGPSMPKASFLVQLLGLITLYGDHAPAEEVWGLLNNKGLCAGRRHCIHGEVRELLTNVWVQEGYVEYRQVPHSDPACYEFLWGPRALMEASKCQVLEYLLRVSGWDSRSFPSLSAEGVSNEEQGA
ncbi:melanoma-associated antigen 8-like [Mesoplodon densirostris]|uniref:melanoma-associated antigen 8-like n=1 Tax=Mesoplodon densirostris TaxID=48708 RepID=UPI0028DD21E7|nr:melanoma-associated antigen 8-like [Mesoplodon densirostris]